MTSMAGLGITTIVIDCRDPHRLARFWADVLGYQPSKGPEDWADLRSEADAGELDWVRLTGAGVAVAFQRVPEAKAVKNRVHMDLASSDEEAEASRLEALGAARLWRSDDPEDVFVVLADPEGNEFCVVRAEA
jgi:catechol 2,3-dioxygenase-like lactoylglutathione lyase family enzyme